MSNKVQAWIYFFAMVSAAIRAAVAYNTGKVEVALAWMIAAGISAGAVGAYLRILDLEKEDKKPE